MVFERDLEMTNLERLLAMKGMTSAELSKFLNISQKSANNKIKRRTEFKYGEALKIATELFPEYAMDYIFEGYGKCAAVC